MLLELESVTVSPQQFLGIELNPRAAAIAELVLWIGYLQWHIRTTGDTPHAEPIIKDFHNIECRDAVLAWDSVEPLLDAQGEPVTRWDGRTTKIHPVTGQQVPDETARIPAYRYHNPRAAEWPQADFIVGNPPFIGSQMMRESLGDEYTETIRKVYHPHVPGNADYVMVWWHTAATKVRMGNSQSFGLIATNSLSQTNNRQVIQKQLTASPPLSLTFAVPDHPWVDSADGAAVRISMTIGQSGQLHGELLKVVEESTEPNTPVSLSRSKGSIHSNLKIGVDVASIRKLESNKNLSFMGVKLVGSGFIVSSDEHNKFLGEERLIRPFRNGRDITQTPRNVSVIDPYGLAIEELKTKYPKIYQHLLLTVKPLRDQNKMKSRREKWWLHGTSIENFRNSAKGIKRYIVTSEVSKHRFFVFLNLSVLPDGALIAITFPDAYYLGILSSRLHIVWSLAVGGRMGVGNDPRYNNSRCFETFPFPDASEGQKAAIRQLAEQLDSHRQRQLGQHPKLTMTGMYNVLEKVKKVTVTSEVTVTSDNTLTAKERQIHEWGLVSILQQLHDELDTAVFAAYGWPPDLSDEEILQRLVDLNAETRGGGSKRPCPLAAPRIPSTR